MQPEVSFAIKNLSNNTSITNWENPKTDRDRIRVSFKNKGKEYSIKSCSMAYEMIKPMKEDEPIIKWWTHL